MLRQRVRQRAESGEPACVDPAVPALEQKRIATLAQELSDKVISVHERPAWRQPARGRTNEVDIVERTHLISSEEASFGAKQDQLFVPYYWNRGDVGVV